MPRNRSLATRRGWLASFTRHFYDPHMSRDVRVHFLPSLFDPDELANGIAVVIDVLRASTTITHALAAEAKAVIPCAELPGGADDVTKLVNKIQGYGSQNLSVTESLSLIDQDTE